MLHSADHDLIVAAARDAGAVALSHFATPVRSWKKGGDSPVSDADIETDRRLQGLLRAARPDYGWLSEETEDDGSRLRSRRSFLADPLDGTRGFLAADPRWAVSVAVIEDGRPVAGVVHCPALARTWSAFLGGGASLDGMPIRVETDARVRSLTGSKRILEELAGHGGENVVLHPFIPSLALRLAMVASGEIDGAFARPGAHDWDIAAADLLLAEAGGSLSTPAGEPCRYNRAGIRAPALVAASAGRRAAMLALAKGLRLNL